MGEHVSEGTHSFACNADGVDDLTSTALVCGVHSNFGRAGILTTQLKTSLDRGPREIRASSASRPNIERDWESFSRDL